MASLTQIILLASWLLLSKWCHASLHASCRIDWTFGNTCDSVRENIIAQVEKWKGDDCGTGEKCRYKNMGYKDNVLKLTHTTPKHNYVDDQTFTFKSEGGLCKVEGYSTSELWYAVLDYGTNYCNLHNLITGAGLDKQANYTEKTSNSQCTQYSSANCDKY